MANEISPFNDLPKRDAACHRSLERKNQARNLVSA